MKRGIRVASKKLPAAEASAGSSSSICAAVAASTTIEIAISAIWAAILPRRENSGRCSTASTMAPTMPMAPPSVGVARPRNMVPSTRKISTSDGTIPHRHFLTSGQPDMVRDSGGMPGTHCGLTKLTISTYLVVAVAHHHGQRDQAHGDHRGGDRAGDGAEDRAHDDHRVAQAAAHRAEQLAEAVEQILGEAAALQDRTHQGEERDREQGVVRQDAEYPLGQRLHEDELEKALLDGDEAEEQAHRREGERDRIAEQHEDDQPPEHEGRHQVMRNQAAAPSRSISTAAVFRNANRLSCDR